MLEAFILVVFPFSMAFAAITDFMSMTIQNRVSLVLVISFALIAPMTGMEWSVFAWHWVAFLVVLSTTIALFATGTMGGGDAKLLASSALWMGFGPALVQYLTLASILGGVVTLTILAIRTSTVASVSGAERYFPHLFDKKAGVPYGIALGAAGLMTYAESDLMQWALARLSA